MIITHILRKEGIKLIKLYLLTGFLGAGKTTFLKNTINLMSDIKLSVIVNEFGKEGVDGKLLQSLGIHVAEINNGSIFCSCRLDKFEDVLLQNIKLSPEVILVEASGLSDPTNIKKILANQAEFSEIEYMGCICLVDAVNFKKVINTARVCNKQISISDIIIINKTDIASKDQIEETQSIILSQYPNAVIHKTSFGKVDADWINSLKSLSHKGNKPVYQTRDVGLQKFLITIKDTFTHYQLLKFIQMFIEDSYRIKGFVYIDNKTYLVDCTGVDLKVVEYDGEVDNLNKIVVLAGASMPVEKSIKKAVDWYSQYIVSVE